MENIEQERTIHLTEYYHVLLKHKWLILASLILVSTLTAFITFRMMPVYQATCVMVIEKERTTSPLTGERIEYEGWYTQSLKFSTHARLITSRPVILQVIKKLKLDQNIRLEKKEIKEINPIRKFFSQFRINIFFLLGKKTEAPIVKDRLAGLVSSIQGMVGIEPIEDTRLLYLLVLFGNS